MVDLYLELRVEGERDPSLVVTVEIEDGYYYHHKKDTSVEDRSDWIHQLEHIIEHLKIDPENKE